jgi:hypothetical protein
MKSSPLGTNLRSAGRPVDAEPVPTHECHIADERVAERSSRDPQAPSAKGHAREPWRGSCFVAQAATIERLLHPGFVKPKEKSRHAVALPARHLSVRESSSELMIDDSFEARRSAHAAHGACVPRHNLRPQRLPGGPVPGDLRNQSRDGGSVQLSWGDAHFGVASALRIALSELLRSSRLVRVRSRI